MFKVKEYKEENSEDDKVIWTSTKVEKLLVAMEEGYATVDHPFYEGDPSYRKGNIVFELPIIHDISIEMVEFLSQFFEEWDYTREECSIGLKNKHFTFIGKNFKGLEENELNTILQEIEDMYNQYKDHTESTKKSD